MSKQALIAILVVILMIFVGGFYHFSKKILHEAMKTGENSILLYVEDGNVSYKIEGGQFIKATSSPVVIANNTIVYTGLGHASILFPNNSTVALDHYTELAVRYDDKKVSLYQTLGTTYHRVEALISGSTYEVETPGTVASVRGTKFAVKYDKQTMTTKVSVTEHQVFVAKTEIIEGTTTKRILESVLLPEGKTAKIEEEATSAEATSIGVTTTTEEPDMELWVEKNKKQDNLEKVLKEENKSKEEIRMEIKKTLDTSEEGGENNNDNQDVKPEDAKIHDDEEKRDNVSAAIEKKTIHSEDISRSKPEIKPAETKKEDTNSQNSQQKGIETNPTNTSEGGSGLNPSGSVKKMDADIFYDKFNTLFVNYFYVDDNDTPCSYKVTPAERVRVVTDFAFGNGYGFPAKGLMDFASDISAYCSNKDARTKATLQGRFDTEFPYQENI